jgi:ribonuclease P protein subunit POP4
MANPTPPTSAMDSIISRTLAPPITSLSDISYLPTVSIGLDNRSTVDLQQKRETARINRHHKWKSLATRKFRQKHQILQKRSLTFEKFAPISKLWDEYADRLPNSEQSVSKMDLHGAKITVVASPDPNLVGIEGRVVKESFGALIVISEDNRIREVIKNHTVAVVETPNGKFEVNLSAIRIRPAMKATKKWKQRSPVPLPY